jgi:hypothetical protein
MDFDEPYWRLYLNKSRYDTIAAHRPADPVIAFDWGEMTGLIPYSYTKEYLVIARGDQASIFERYAGQDNVLGTGEGAEEIEGVLWRIWNEKDRASRFHRGRFYSCNLRRVTRLQRSYYYIVDFC